MELSPEERQRIYEEEKARHEAQEKLRAQQRPKKLVLGALGCVTAPALGCAGVIVLFVMLVVAAAVLGPCIGASNQAGSSRVLVSQGVRQSHPERVTDKWVRVS